MNLMNDITDSVIQEMKQFLLKSYIDNTIEFKRKYYGLEDEEKNCFDEGWGIPSDLSIKELEILQVFKYHQDEEELSLELLKEKWKYDLLSK